MGGERLKILYVSSEVAPLSKTGGLADVSGSLPKAIKALGHDVRVVTPYYKMVKKHVKSTQKVLNRLDVPVSDKEVRGSVEMTQIDGGVPVYLIKKESYFGRDDLYTTKQGDYKDNAERFVFFSRGVLEMLRHIDFKPDIIHCNDWQAGLIPTYLKTLYRKKDLYKDICSIFTIHNLGYQGIFWSLDMHLTNLPWDIFTINGVEYYGNISFLKAGMVYADILTTVSKGYSKEIQTPEYGLGMDGILRTRQKDLYGILNGADYDHWSPDKDPYIVAPYDKSNLENKTKCKLDLLQEFGLKCRATTPIIGMISRLADQKGFDILAESIDELMKMDIIFILLGTGDQKYEEMFTHIGDKYPKKTGIRIGFDNALAHKIEAGSDIYLMPSKYEPCGLNQIYSLRYGTIPVVRATGGLDDTIIDIHADPRKGNGFKFTDYTSKGLLATIKRACDYYSHKEAWAQLVWRAMSLEYSWEKSAREYLKLYQDTLKKKAMAPVG
ncbi:MAG: glycogen synthase GlgA [bacterium]